MPAALHQCPQPVGEIWMGRSGRARAIHYSQRSRGRQIVMERNRGGKHLDHDHREREDVRLFAVRPLLVQDLGRSPSCGMTVFV
jgi:hypothetical protein